MEKIFYIEKNTTPIQKSEYIQKVIDNCKLKIGDKVRLNCDSSPEMVINNITVTSSKNYELDCVFLDATIHTKRFNRSKQEFVTDLFTEEVLIKIE